MNKYNLYMFLRSLGELIAILLPLFITLTVGIVVAVVARLWLRHRAIPARILRRIVDLERRVAAIEQDRER